MLKKIIGLFKKKQKTIEEPINVKPLKTPKMDFSTIKFDFNIKSICYFESLVNKSFFDMNEDDVFDMLYSIYMVNNPDKKIKKQSFFNIIQREDIMKWMLKKYVDNAAIWNQFQTKTKLSTDGQSMEQQDASKTRMIDYVSTLIIEYGMDAHYVYYEMDIWEIGELFEAIETKLKRDAIEKRFWTYLMISPHIDTKKCKSPEAFLPFEWEKESIKKRREQELKNNMFAIKNTIGKSIFAGKEKKNEQG